MGVGGSPDSFIHWVTPTVAGLRQPGREGHLESDLEALQSAGVSILVSLTVRALPETKLARYGIRSRHFPIIGMGVPTLEAAMGLCEEMSQAVRVGSKVAVHCTQGVGRTGTVLACHLVWQGMSAQQAIARVRQRIPGAIQTAGQEAFVCRFARATPAQ
jgi:atypical dual specificity phosphatase